MVGTLKTCCPRTTSCAFATRNITTDQSQPKLNFDQVRASSMNGNGRQISIFTTDHRYFSQPMDSEVRLDFHTKTIKQIRVPGFI